MVSEIETFLDISEIIFLLDIDECSENTDGCAQQCTNTDGSFICSCDSGYTLGSDQWSCIGV